MSGNSFLLDTNIVLYLLSGNRTIADTIDGSILYISFITQLEVLGYKGITKLELKQVKLFLNQCLIIDMNEEIKNVTVSLKQSYKLKLPDAIIAATSLYLDVPLLTADKGFSKLKEIKIALYED